MGIEGLKTSIRSIGIGGALLLSAACGGDDTTGTVDSCGTVSDCAVAVPECRVAVACTNGACVFNDAVEGTALAGQTAGDCVDVVCDGKGATKDIPAPMDISNDANPCTVDACDGATPTHTVAAAVPCYSGPPGTDGKGACKQGMQQCDAAGEPVGACAGEVIPAAESCATDFDDDCDGAANEDEAGCVCEPGSVQACYTGAPSTKDVGICHEGTQACNADGLGFGACNGEQTPKTEDCEGAALDEDCDALINEDGASCSCGDSIVSSGLGEGCDDGEQAPGGGCDATCQREPVSALAAGTSHTCALLFEGRVKCWGSGSGLGSGDIMQIGNEPGEMGAALPAVDLGTGKTAVEVVVGDLHTCAILNDGSLKCWGYNLNGELGLGDNDNRGDEPGEMGDALPAVDLGAGKTAVRVALGYEHTCAILNDGSVKCWGAGGVLGTGDFTYRGDQPGEMGDALPVVDLGTGKTAVEIGAGAAHTCALLNDGTIKCWGENLGGQLGLGDTDQRGDNLGEMGDSLPAVNLGTGQVAAAISVGIGPTCALLNNGALKCWGYNNSGQLGLEDNQNRGDDPGEMGDVLPSVNLGTGKTAAAITSGYGHACAILNDGSIKCWGEAFHGQIGIGDQLARGDAPGEMGDALPAVDLGSGKTAVRIDSFYKHTCVSLNDGSVKCWGLNDTAQLGLGHSMNIGHILGQMGDALPIVHLYSDAW